MSLGPDEYYPSVYVHAGEAIDITPDENLHAGAVVIVEDIVGVTKRPIAAGETGALHLVGVFWVAKKASDGTIDQGELVYWHPDEGCTKTDSGAKKLGYAAADAVEADTSMLVRLSP